MNRGSASIRPRNGARTKGFNEAPIHESGKFREVLDGCGGDARFNEAPIHESGKYDGYRGHAPGPAPLQ